MKILILAIGKIKSGPIRQLAADYAERLGHYVPLTIVAARDEKAALGRIEPDDFLVVCDERGAQKTSVELSEFIAEHRAKATRRIVFFIGGPEGHGEQVRRKADALLGLSRMTFPHELTQALLLEQLYRACTILRGEQYHK